MIFPGMAYLYLKLQSCLAISAHFFIDED